MIKNSTLIVLLSFTIMGCSSPHTYQPSAKDIAKENAENFACKPNKPLSKGELYERAMQDYWDDTITTLWRLDKAYYEEMSHALGGYASKTYATYRCGLKWTLWGTPDKIMQDACYPLVVNQPDSFGEFQEKTNKNLSNIGTVYNPENDPPIYKAEFYNKDVEFAVIDQRPLFGRIMPRDCCKLMTYQEILALKAKYHDQWKDGIWLNGEFNNNKIKNQGEDYHYLVVKTLYSSSHKRGYNIHFRSHIISHCGKILKY